MKTGIARKERNHPHFRLEALLHIHQVEALEQANREGKQAKQQFAFGQTVGMSLTSLLREGLQRNSLMPPMTSTGMSDHLQGCPEDESQEEAHTGVSGITTTEGTEPQTPGQIVDHQGEGYSPFMVGEGSDDDSGAHLLASGNTLLRGGSQTPLADLETTSREELQNEVTRLQETVRTCYESLQSVQQNADLKVQQLELRVLFLERKLADEQVLTNSLSSTNQSLKQELHAAYTQSKERDEKHKMKKMISLHLREVAMEKNLNTLRIARNEAVHQNTILQRMLLQTCHKCRKNLPIQKIQKLVKPPLQSETQAKSSIPHVEFRSALSLAGSASSLGSTSPRFRKTTSAATESCMSSSTTSSFSSFGMSPGTASSQFPELTRLHRLSSSSLDMTEEDNRSAVTSTTASTQAVKEIVDEKTGMSSHLESASKKTSVTSLPLPLIRTPTSGKRKVVVEASSTSTPTFGKRKVVEASMTPKTPTTPATLSTATFSPSSDTSPELQSSGVNPKPRWLRIFVGKASSFHDCHNIPKLKSSDPHRNERPSLERRWTIDHMEQPLQRRQRARPEENSDQARQSPTAREHGAYMFL